MQSFENLLWVLEDRILTLTINRESKLNALNSATLEELKIAFQSIYDDESIGGVILTGAGEKAFVAGADIAEISKLTEVNSRKFAEVGQEIFLAIENCPKPVIAAVNGFALGGGCEIAAACDIRLARAEAKVGFIQGRLGITTGWGGGTYLLERIGQAVAMDLLYSSTPVTAKRGMDLGFIQYVIKGNSFKETERYLQRYTQQPLGVITSYKTLQLQRYDGAKIKKSVLLEIERCAKLWASDDHHKRVEAFLNK